MSVAASTAPPLPDARVGPSPVPLEPDLSEARWKPLLGLPCQLTADLSVPEFRVSDLLKLHVGSVIGTGWHASRDVPLRINGTLVGWSEFEVVGNRLAVRVTELA